MAQLNLLVFGETGVGKSTFINAFANYLKYHNFQDALENTQVTLIPTTFSVTDENYKTKIVKTAKQDDNEVTEVGRSATQSCKSYVFKFKDYSLRIIDTPGIGDTRGQEVDKQNFENVLSFIGQLDELHAICILMKPNNTRITPSFEYCLKQLLCQLAKSACNNIMFIFTHARGTFYKPGESLTSLKSLLKTIADQPPHVEVPLNKDTIFCVDNEAFRFILCAKNGITYSKQQIGEFKASWRHALAECVRLIKRIVDIEPHKVRDTLSVNECLRLVGNLAKPLCDIIDNIQDNILAIKEHGRDLMNNQRNIDYLKNKLYIPQYDLKYKELDKPATVCTHSSCVETCEVGDRKKILYTQRCHQPCQLTSIPKDVVGDKSLLNCYAFLNNKYSCHICGHQYTDHMHVYYENEVVVKYVEDKQIKSMIKDKDWNKTRAKNIIEMSKEQLLEFEREQQLIVKAIAYFSVFLKTNSLSSFSDIFERYLKHLIQNEKVLHKSGSNNLSKIQSLEAIFDEYKDKKKTFEEEASRGKTIKSERVFEIINIIMNLKLTGNKIKELSLKQQVGRKQMVLKQEVVCDLKGKMSLKQIFKLKELKNVETDNESEIDSEIDVVGKPSVKPRTNLKSISNESKKKQSKIDEEINKLVESLELSEDSEVSEEEKAVEDEQVKASKKTKNQIKSNQKEKKKCPTCKQWIRSTSDNENDSSDEQMDVDEMNDQMEKLAIKDDKSTKPVIETNILSTGQDTNEDDKKNQNCIIIDNLFDSTTFAVKGTNLQITLKPTEKKTEEKSRSVGPVDSEFSVGESKSRDSEIGKQMKFQATTSNDAIKPIDHFNGSKYVSKYSIPGYPYPSKRSFKTPELSENDEKSSTQNGLDESSIGGQKKSSKSQDESSNDQQWLQDQFNYQPKYYPNIWEKDNESK